jgi:predicted kinase
MEAYVMCGAPGSGKSTQAQKIADIENASIVSGDRIRYELYGDACIQGNWAEIHDEIESQVANAAALRRPVILDGTHWKKSYRSEAITLLKSYGYIRIEAIVCNPSLETCVARNLSRSRNVPDYVLKMTYEEFQRESKDILSEEFDRITFVF